MTTLTPSKPELIDLHPPAADMLRLVRQGLQQEPRQLPAWFLYDAEGSRLFDQICEQPEYSLTRTEIGLLEHSAAEIAAALGAGVIVEFGAGSARKVGTLLNALQPSAYVALDISADHLRQATADLQTRHPSVPMLGICCDHSALTALPEHPLLQGQRRIGFFSWKLPGQFHPPGGGCAAAALPPAAQWRAPAPWPGSTQDTRTARGRLQRCRRRLRRLCPQPAPSAEQRTGGHVRPRAVPLRRALAGRRAPGAHGPGEPGASVGVDRR